jgi:GNAT superfamily N-acetyltransferase
MSGTQDIRIGRVGPADLRKFEEFLRRDAAQAEPGDSDAPQAFVHGFRKSLKRFDFLSSESHWLVAAELDGQYVGYFTAVRVHKADGRAAVLFVDEIMVLAKYRRRGVGRALWREIECIARQIGAWRIRLCVDSGNEIAREFYGGLGLQETPLILCQKAPQEFRSKEPDHRGL